MDEIKNINVFAPNQFDNIYYKAPVVGNRAPTSNDRRKVSTVWIDTTTDIVYINSSIAGGNPNWINMREDPFTYTKTSVTVAGFAVTSNERIGYVVLTGRTTGAGAQATVTLTNSNITAASAMMVTVTNTGANDARMTLERVYPKAGSADIMLQNNGAAALNGNIVISFWVLS